MLSDDDVALAGELALGVLEDQERADALRRQIADPAFAAEVARWRDRLGPLHAEWPEVDPGTADPRRALAGGDQVARRWRWIAAASSVAAAVLLAILLLRPVTVAPPPAVRSAPSLVAVLKPDQGEPFGAVYDPAARQVRLTITTVPVPPGRDAELWAIGGDGVPHAAGLLRGSGVLAVSARGVTIGPGSTLAISIEPVGGSPQPTPTGPVVATGKLVPI